MRPSRDRVAGGVAFLLAVGLLGLSVAYVAAQEPYGGRWLWRQAALGPAVVLAWAARRTRRREGGRGDRVLWVALGAGALAGLLVPAEGMGARGAGRIAAWIVAMFGLGFLWPDGARPGRGAGVVRAARSAGAWLRARPTLVGIAVFGLATGACALEARHGVDPMGPVTGHDAFCYVLQAKTFLAGRLANPPHPHWEFFQVFHTISHPFYQAKYPPGYALLLSPGLALGIGRYVPAILMGLGAWGTLAVGRRLFGLGPGLLAAAWLVSFPKFRQLGSWHMSNTAMVALSIWLLHLYLCSREDPRRTWPFVAGGLLVALAVLVRPLDALLLGVLFAVPWAMAAWRALPPREAAKRLALTVALAALGPALLAGYSRGVTGRFTELPYRVYERQYDPTTEASLVGDFSERPYQRWERLHRDYESTLPPAPLPHRPELLPGRLGWQLGAMARESSWAVVLAAAAGLALGWGRRRAAAALLLLAALFWVGYGVTASRATRYLWPTMPFVVLALVGGAASARTAHGGRPGFAWLGVLPAVGVLLLLIPNAFLLKRSLDPERGYYEMLWTAVREAPGERKLVFINYDDWHLGQEYAYNGPDIDEQEVVFAQDLGERNRELMAYDPTRWVYRYVVAEDRLIHLRKGSADRPPGDAKPDRVDR